MSKQRASDATGKPRENNNPKRLRHLLKRSDRGRNATPSARLWTNSPARFRFRAKEDVLCWRGFCALVHSSHRRRLQ